jgi:hypothetical protein
VAHNELLAWGLLATARWARTSQVRSASAGSTDRLLDGMIVPALTTVTARAD